MKKFRTIWKYEVLINYQRKVITQELISSGIWTIIKSKKLQRKLNKNKWIRIKNEFFKIEDIKKVKIIFTNEVK